MKNIILPFLFFLTISTYLNAEEGVSVDKNNGFYFGFDVLHSPNVTVDLLYEGEVVASDETSSNGLRIKLGNKDGELFYGAHFGYETFDSSLLTSERSVMQIFGGDLRYLLPMDESSGLFF